MGEGITLHSTSVRVRASNKSSDKRIARNNADADKLEKSGYSVERNKHRNGAYFAVIGNHPQHEIEVGRIFAENGFAFTLDREGNAKIRIKGIDYKLPSSDGHVEGFTHEIYKLGGKPDPRTVAEAIKHSYKPFARDETKNLQSDIAISFTPKGSKYTRKDIADGVKEYKRQRKEDGVKANPLLYLHVNETTRAIYRWNIK